MSASTTTDRRRPTARPTSPSTAVQYVESAEKRRQRLSTGGLIAVVGVLLLIAARLDHRDGPVRPVRRLRRGPAAHPDRARGRHGRGLRGALPGCRRPASCPGGCRAGWPAVAGTVAGLAVVVGFLTWAAAGRDLPFPVSNQFAGTLSLATPLVFGALCGVLCERAGVVNVSIEGQFLAAAFAAAVVGSVTESIPAALLAAMIAGVVHGGAARPVLDQLPGQPGGARRGAEPARRRGHRVPVRPAGPAGVADVQLRAGARADPDPGPVGDPVLRPGAVRAERSWPTSPRSAVRGGLAGPVPDHLGAADPVRRRASGGGRHRRHQRPRRALVGGAGRRGLRPVSAGRSSPWPRPGRSPRSSPSATASSPWPR